MSEVSTTSKVQFMVANLSIEHRGLETVWKRAESRLKGVTKGRNANPMAALGMSLHMRHAPLQVVPFV